MNHEYTTTFEGEQVKFTVEAAEELPCFNIRMHKTVKVELSKEDKEHNKKHSVLIAQGQKSKMISEVDYVEVDNFIVFCSLTQGQFIESCESFMVCFPEQLAEAMKDV